MPIPTRPPPRPPSNFKAQITTGWSDNDLFGATSTMQPNQKKKPPPRPPPPRFKKDYAPRQDDVTKRPTKPTELLTNLFGRRTQRKQENHGAGLSTNRQQYSSTGFSNPAANADVALIDLSPSGSPTFIARSNSDGVSVDSFGSDGNSNPSLFTSSGNTSQTESAFEDDFDFFGSLTSAKTTSNDPWKVTAHAQDFFTSTSGVNTTRRVGDANFFAYNETETSNRNIFDTPMTNSASTMPTIIRARLPKPPASKNLNRSLAPIVTDFNALAATNSALSNYNPSAGGSSGIIYNTLTEWPDNFHENPSPPMPSIPPPAPPNEFFQKNENTMNKSNVLPHGIALYDFAASQSGDLELKQNDVVTLVRSVNDEWLEGRIGNRFGIFPANFVDIVVPLPGSCNNLVNALYTFRGETWDDLPFEEGEKITVLSRISDDWLYGECRGKKGQFPANYVDRVPRDLPKSS